MTWSSIRKWNWIVTCAFGTVAGLWLLAGHLTGSDAHYDFFFWGLLAASFGIVLLALFTREDAGSELVSPGGFVTIAMFGFAAVGASSYAKVPDLIVLGAMIIATGSCSVIAAYLAKSEGDTAPLAVLVLEAIPLAGLLVSFVRSSWRQGTVWDEADPQQAAWLRGEPTK